ncbi:hypothetical protein [uncultured Roseobacter sp.]|uniref:hypothetical protein n=1 Tax=uncultured Roseobacter sp. TaxID=114847 RepID=UPI00260E0ACA|nr:hypothetical protein [uncultured Roseobacter sp.]
MAEADADKEAARHLVVSQPCKETYALSGSEERAPIRHRVAGDVVHRTDEPVVHMHLWNEECVGKLDHQVHVNADKDNPVNVAHRFPDTHAQTHQMQTSLAEPVHHALQMRTPLQVRFCNSWQVASDYSVQVGLRGRPFLDIRLTGATVATPQSCPEDEKPGRDKG